MTPKQKYLIKLFVSFPMAADEAQEVLLGAYLEAIDGVQDWALRRAVRQFVQGKAERSNHAFRPSTAELRLEIERVLAREAERQNQPIVAEQIRKRDAGEDAWWRHRSDELVTIETVQLQPQNTLEAV